MRTIAVKKLPKDPGPAGWNQILPPLASSNALDQDITADWLVIGAGFAGLSAARRLSQICENDRIVVLDATRVGDGPAGRNSGFMIDLPHDLSSTNYSGELEVDRHKIADNRAGITFAKSMAEDFQLTREAFDQCGKINGAATERGIAFNAEYARHIAALGESCEQLSAVEMKNVTGTNYYKSGLFTPGVAVIQPALFVRGVASGLKSTGIRIHENSPVVSLERKQDWVAKTHKGSVTAPRVILAVNGHLNSFGYMARRFLHVFTYASMTRPLTRTEIERLGGEASWGITSADPLGSSVRRITGTGGARIVIRNRFTCDPSMEVSSKRLVSMASSHKRAFMARFPMLSAVSMEHSWGGRLCISLNDVQVVQELDEGLYSACCQNGLGTAKGTFAGKMAAELATDQSSPALRRLVNSSPPARLPPDSLTKIGAHIRVKWGELRAGREL